MSKAFAGESDNEDNEILQAPVLPPGTRNYITPAGARKLTADRERVIAERKTLGEETFENRQRRRLLDRKLEFLTERLNTAHIVDPSVQPPDQILFGARVVVRDAQGKEQTWRIVGIDEIDLNKGLISWISPLARALLDKRVGDTVSVGTQKLTVLRIHYPAD